MNKALIDELIEKLVKECGTRDPFKIARQKNIIVLEEPLKEIKGYYNKIKRIQMIHTNDELEYFERMFVCAHELGHALLHPNDQTNKLSTYSTVSTLKKEGEANYFATNLIVDGTVAWEIENPTNEQIMNFYGIPREMERFINR